MGPRVMIAIIVLSVCGGTGCILNMLEKGTAHKTATSPDVSWKPSPSEVPRYTPPPLPPAIPPDLLRSKEHLALRDIVDIALRNSPDTRAAWSDARSAAAALGSQKGTYYPEVDASGGILYQKGRTLGTSFEQTTYGPIAEFNWMLFNFGGREASVEEARQDLFTANWTHNATIQNVALTVEEAYFQYLSAKALVKAEEATVKEAQTNLDAAQERHKVGVATIADVLQAKTTLSQAQLNLETTRGQIQTTRGALATAMGLPANISFDVELPPEGPPMARISGEVEHFIEAAQTKRPDLAAARSTASKAQTHIGTVKAARYPSFVASGSFGRTFYYQMGGHADNSLAGLEMQIPLFNGFSREYDVLKAKADAETAQARLASLEQQAVLQVWTSYFNFKTAEQRVKTSQDLLESAQQSYAVALGRYKEGVGSILDLLSAQRALEDARAQRIESYTDLFLSLAQLAHDTGTLWVGSDSSTGAPPSDFEMRVTP